MLVYQITNVANGKVYVGQTTMDLAHRWDCHVWSARRSRTPLARAIAKHGREAFRVNPIVSVESKRDLDEAERFWIEQHRCMAPRGYNLTLGGQLSGGKQSDDVCLRKSASQRERYKRPGVLKRQTDIANAIWARADVRAKHSASLRRFHEERRAAGIALVRSPFKKSAAAIEATAAARRIAIVATAPDGTETKFRSMTEASRATGVVLSAISHCVSGKRAQDSGYTFRREK